MTILGQPTSWNSVTSPITASLHVPVDPDAPVALPHLTCEPMVGVAEAAVLFAAGHLEGGRVSLEDVWGREPHEPRARVMLLDLHRAQDQRAAFDAAHERYRNACTDAPRPPWNYSARPAVSERLELAGSLATQDQLRPIFDYARTHKLVAIDLAGVSRIDF